MNVDDLLLRRLETLAGLACDPRERDILLDDLRRMIGFVDRLDAYVADEVQEDPSSETIDRRRDDTPHCSLPADQAVASAPAVVDGCFFCPPIRGGD